MVKLGLAGKAGVTNLEQEPGGQRSALNGDVAPAYRAIRTNRYLFVIYSTGASELYDMAKDPGQLTSLIRQPPLQQGAPQVAAAADPAVGMCVGSGCNASYGPDPKPLPEEPSQDLKEKGREAQEEVTGHPGLEPGIADFGGRCLSQFGQCPNADERTRTSTGRRPTRT